MEWQDISTAPRDGTPVQLKGGYIGDNEEKDIYGPSCAYWGETSHGEECWIIGSFDGGYLVVKYEEPTHWAPLQTPISRT
jgi:hypothetical protein